MTRRKLSPRSEDPWTNTTVAAPGAGAGRDDDMECGRIAHGQGRRYPSAP